MGFSFVHLLLVAGVVALLFGPKPFQKAGRGAGDFWRGLKRGYEGKEDIDITDSVKQLKDDHRD